MRHIYRLDRVRHRMIDAADELRGLMADTTDPDALWEVVCMLYELEAKVAVVGPTKG